MPTVSHLLSSLLVHSSERPAKRHPPSPTPTVVPSSTASATPAPASSPTFTATPTTKATVPANATPPVKATMFSVMGKASGSPRRTPGAMPPTSSTGSPAVPQKGEGAVLPLAIGIGIAAGLLLMAVGLALRIGLRPARKRKLSPSGAAPWAARAPTDLDECISNSRSSGQPLAMTDALPHATGKSIPSRTEGSLTTNPPVAKRRSMVLAQHFLRPTRLKALHTNESVTRSQGQSLKSNHTRASKGERKKTRSNVFTT